MFCMYIYCKSINGVWVGRVGDPLHTHTSFHFIKQFSSENEKEKEEEDEKTCMGGTILAWLWKLRHALLNIHFIS